MSSADTPTPSIRLWELYFLVVAVAVAAAIVLADWNPPVRRAVAVAAVAGMAVLYLAAARPLIRRDAQGTPSLMVSLALLALFSVAVACVPLSTWVMFMIVPMFFMLVPLRRAVALVLVANLVPVLLEARAGLDGFGIDLVIAAISTAGGVCIGVWITRMAEQSEQRAQLIAELEANRAEVARLSHEAGVASERARLAGEIHDTLAQGFTSIITLLQAADPALRDERLALAVRTARENLAESRAIVAALSPSALASAASLPDAVRRQASRFAEEAGVPAPFRVTGDVRELPTRVEVVLLRAAQEALTNVRRHARAREAAVLLAYTPATVRLVVRDDGVGFDPATADGYGLSGMRARATQAGGTLVVHSDPDTGTTLEVEIPE